MREEQAAVVLCGAKVLAVKAATRGAHNARGSAPPKAGGIAVIGKITCAPSSFKLKMA